MVSHKHKCIFVHIPKTAGMSVENAFLQSLNLKFYKGQAPSLILSYNSNYDLGPPSLAHLTAEEYVKHSFISQELFNEYFKFTFIRNPYERIVSIYRYFGFHRILKFEKFMEIQFPLLQKEREYFVRPQVDYIFDERGNQLVDFVGKFENLQQDFEKIKTHILGSIAPLKHINENRYNYNWYSRWNLKYIYKTVGQYPYLLPHIYLFNPVYDCYQDYYTTKARKLVEKFYSRDIEYFNYQFGSLQLEPV